MKRFLKTAAIALVAAVGGVSSTSFGQVVSVSTNIASGSTYDGWTITFPSDINLVVDPASTGSELQLEKLATFKSASSGLIITFVQASANAASTFDINGEALTNESGVNWGGFQYLLINHDAGAAFTQSAGSPFAPPVGYNAVSFSSTSVVYSGSQANGATSDWGMDPADGGLIWTVDPAGVGTRFDLKEIPLTGGFTPVVPLPAAGWQGLSGLLGLGAIALGKNLKKKVLA
jgi:hypothetical protein